MDKLKILAVADLNTLGSSLLIVLHPEGFDVTVVDTYTGPVNKIFQEIFEELSRKNYEIILLTNNGLRPSDILILIPEIKKKHPDIKIVVLSGLSTPEFVRDLMKLGIDGFLPLPFSVVDLIQTVSSILEGKGKVMKEAQKKM